MGFGDELMAMGEAETIHRVTGAKVLIVDAQGKPRWSPVWERHPAIARDEGEPHRVRLTNGPEARPYIRTWGTADGKPMAIYNSWRAQDHLGRLHLSPAELDLGSELQSRVGSYVVVEPHVKGQSSPNKDWGFDRFQEAVRLMPGVNFVQLGHEVRPLEGVTRVRTTSFRDACGVMAHAMAYLGPEGGLHHAAGALRVPAVVIFGAFVSPWTTGYSFHRNFYIDDGHGPCGRWAPCAECARLLARIQPEDVATSLLNLMSTRTQMLAHASVCGHCQE